MDRRTDGRTDGRGRCNISRPGPSAPREIKIPNCHLIFKILVKWIPTIIVSPVWLYFNMQPTLISTKYSFNHIDAYQYWNGPCYVGHCTAPGMARKCFKWSFFPFKYIGLPFYTGNQFCVELQGPKNMLLQYLLSIPVLIISQSWTNSKFTLWRVTRCAHFEVAEHFLIYWIICEFQDGFTSNFTHISNRTVSSKLMIRYYVVKYCSLPPVIENSTREKSVLLLLGWEQNVLTYVWEHTGQLWLVNKLYQPMRNVF